MSVIKVGGRTTDIFYLPLYRYLLYLGISRNGQARQTSTRVSTPIPTSTPTPVLHLALRTTGPLYAVPGFTKRNTKRSRLTRGRVLPLKKTQSMFVSVLKCFQFTKPEILIVSLQRTFRGNKCWCVGKVLMKKHAYEYNASSFILSRNIGRCFFGKFGFEEIYPDKSCHL